MLAKKNILGVGITNASKHEVLEYIIEKLQQKDKKFYVVTPNPEILVFVNKNNDFKNILNNAELALNDGVGVSLASRVLGRPLKDRFTGVDFMEMLCKGVSEKPITVGFLGGGPKIAERTAECLVSKYPKLKIAFVAQEWPQNSLEFRVQSSESEKETKDQRLTTIDILFIAFGFPKQEEWISKNLDKLPVQCAVGVGGAFDYISGNISRAPRFVQQIGFEWLYRLIRQPWRIKRQLALTKFVYLVFKERFI